MYDDLPPPHRRSLPPTQALQTPTGNGHIALVEPFNTMRMGEHRERQLAAATASADLVYWFQPPGMNWSLESVVEHSAAAQLADNIDELVRNSRKRGPAH